MDEKAGNKWTRESLSSPVPARSTVHPIDMKYNKEKLKAHEIANFFKK